MDMILELLHNAFKHGNIPSSNYNTKKLLNKLGLHYTKIHAFPNNCMLYQGRDEGKKECKTCKRSKWKQNGHETTSEHNLINEKQQNKIASKSFTLLSINPTVENDVYVFKDI